jgi:hypothetical protein
MFISHHVFGDFPTLNWMKQFWPVSQNDPFLIFTLKAVFLAYFSNEVRSPPILQQARKAYSSALTLTNQALHSQDTALKNTTLLTVLLLDLFENLTNDEPNSACKHRDGALALLKFRGPNQFEDPVSLSMFQHLSSNLIPSCLERGVAVPKDFLRLRRQAARFASAEDPEWRLLDIMVQLATLRDAVKSSKHPSTSALATAQYLDLELLDLCKTMPEPNSPNNTKASQSPSSENTDNRPSQKPARESNLHLIRTLLDETLGKLRLDPA